MTTISVHLNYYFFKNTPLLVDLVSVIVTLICAKYKMFLYFGVLHVIHLLSL